MTDTTNTDAAAADLNSLELAVFIARVIDEKQGENTIVIPVGPVVGITEYFIVTSASNVRLVRAITDAVLNNVREAVGKGPLRSEGTREQQWVLIDYGDVVVHIFIDEMRRFYEIERLYKDIVPTPWA
ncbi:MAG: ribosome silencing factor [Actinomycetota bacterium]|nr:ribosome silencing factor [Actinomycetota bacterium]